MNEKNRNTIVFIGFISAAFLAGIAVQYLRPHDPGLGNSGQDRAIEQRINDIFRERARTIDARESRLFDREKRISDRENELNKREKRLARIFDLIQGSTNDIGELKKIIIEVAERTRPGEAGE